MSIITVERTERQSQKRAFYSDPDRKPVAPAPLWDEIPDELRAARRWVLWRLQWKGNRNGGGKWDKVPHQSNGACAKSNAPDTWGTLEAVRTACSRGGFDGIGFVLGDGFVGIDLDDVRDRDSGTITAPWVAELIDRNATYAEVSPSGTGVKLFGHGTWSGGWHKRPHPSGAGEIEVYDTARFFCVTGNPTSARPVADIQSVLDDLTGLFEEAAPGIVPEGSGATELSDADLIERAKRAKNGNQFDSLWSGNWRDYPSQSEADLALCGMLAFWTGNDRVRIDRLFRSSGLMRPKWDEMRGERTYGEATIRTALSARTTVRDSESPGGGPPTGAPTQADCATVPTIVVGTDEYRVSDEVVAALASWPEVYQRGGCLVRVLEATDEQAPLGTVRRPVGAPVVRSFCPPSLRELMSRCVRWVQPTNMEPKPVHPPMWSVNAVLARGAWPAVRPLEAVVTHPVLLPDGTVLATRGYDRGSGLLVRAPANLAVAVPDRPTRDDVRGAAAALLDVVCDFPFERPEHRAAWVAGLLTPLAWFAFDGPAPLFLIDKNVRGAGAGLLAHTIARVLTGRTFPVMNYTNDAAELRKKITSLAVEGERLVLFDNLAGAVGNEVLDAALTSDRWKDRLLGENRVYDGPLNVSWFATANNAQLRADTARRVCHIRMETAEERPELRTGFKYPDLSAHVAANRGPLLSAALTILRGWAVAGRPRHQLPAWGSFEGWSSAVREAVVFAGLPDPGETRDALQTTADRDAVAMGAILGALEHMDPHARGVTTSEVIELVKRPLHPPEDWHGELRSAVEELCGRLDGRLLGYKFRHFQRRNFGGRMLDKGAADHGSTRWVVRPAEGIRDGSDHVPHVPHVPVSGTRGGHGGDGGHDLNQSEFAATPSSEPELD